MKKNNIIKLILFFIGCGLLFFLVYRAGFSAIIETVKKAKLYFIFLGVLVYLAVIFFRSLRWFLLIRVNNNNIKYRKFLPLYLANSLISNLTPFKSGEAVAPLLFKKYLKIPVGQGFSAIILDRFLELLFFVIILIIASFYMLNSGVQNALISSILKGALTILFIFLAIFVIFITSKKITFKIIRAIKFLRFVEKEADIFYSILPLLFKKTYQFIIPLILLGWFLEVSAAYLAYQSIFFVSFIDVAIAQAIALGFTLISFIPAGMGVVEFGVVNILHLFGYSQLLATSATLVARFFLTGALLVSGLIGSLFIKEEKHNAQESQ